MCASTCTTKTHPCNPSFRKTAVCRGESIPFSNLCNANTSDRKGTLGCYHICKPTTNQQLIGEYFGWLPLQNISWRQWEVTWLAPNLVVFFTVQSIRLLKSHLNYDSYLVRMNEWKLLSSVWLFLTSGAVAHQAHLAMRFSRQEYWSGVAILSSIGSSQPRDWTWVSCIAGRFFIDGATREAPYLVKKFSNSNTKTLFIDRNEK